MVRFREDQGVRRVQTGTGGAAGLSSLADRLNQFSSQQASIAASNIQAKSQQAAVQGEASFDPNQPLSEQVEEVPAFFGQEKAAFNKGLRAAYVAGIDRDIRENLNRIKAENPSNLTAFNEEANSYLDATLQEMDASARPLIQDRASSLLSTVRSDVQVATINRQRSDADAESVSAIEQAAQDSYRFTNQGNTLAAAESLVTAFDIIDSRVESGMILPAEAVEQKRKLEMGATVENIRYTLDKTIKDKGVIEAVNVISLAEDKPLKGFNVDEQDALVTTLKADLNQFITLQNITEREQEESLRLKQGAAYGSLYTGILSGDTDAADVRSAITGKQISTDQGQKLINIFQTRGQGVDDFSLIRDIQELSITSPDIARRMIEDNTGSRLTESTANNLYLTAINASDDESPLQSSRAKRFSSFLTNSVKVVGPLGAIDFESQERLAKLRVVYDERVLAGDDPAIVARDLVDVNAVLTAPNPMYGNKDNLDKSQSDLDNALLSGSIDEDTYNRESELIKDLKEKAENIKSFQSALTEALKEGKQ